MAGLELLEDEDVLEQSVTTALPCYARWISDASDILQGVRRARMRMLREPEGSSVTKTITQSRRNSVPMTGIWFLINKQFHSDDYTFQLGTIKEKMRVRQEEFWKICWLYGSGGRGRSD